MKTGVSVLLFAVFLVYGIFAIVHYEYAKTAAGYDWWLYSGIGACVLAAAIAIVGFMGQGRSKKG